MYSTVYSNRFISQYGGVNINKDESQQNARMVFSGPDYLRDHRVKVEADHRNVGVGSRSTELSSEVNYLWRGAPNAPFPCSRGGRVGDIGWGIPFFSDWSLQRTGEQIMLGEFRQALEDLYTHRLQNPRDSFKTLNVGLSQGHQETGTRIHRR